MRARAALALVIIGEIGHVRDLSGNPGLVETMRKAIEQPKEEVRSSGAYALGAVAVGSTKNFLPTILSAIEGEQSNKYATMTALKELVGVAGRLEEAEVKQVKDILTRDMGTEDEHLRALISECLGKLAVTAPAKIVPVVHDAKASMDAKVRESAIASVQSAIREQSPDFGEHIDPVVESFLSLMDDDDHGVRLAALQAFKAMLHYKPTLVWSRLPGILPSLYGQCETKEELIREIDLGPFKQRIDDGLPVRQAAYSCLDVLLQTLPERLDPNAFLAKIKEGLQDDHDVRLLCHMILLRMCSLPSFRQPLLAHLDALVPPLKGTLTAKLRKDANTHEERLQDELVRSALRAIDALERLPDVDSCTGFKEFLSKTVYQEPLKSKLAHIRSEHDAL